ncbi:PapB family radical SAM/SPASM ranthipeptide maturase [Corallococcus carmarthensis]|uniref:PapB family radical SAM/SPASM ranthipeptide maturase n=1 Tax=Corallococcus carmarthensis TaxID=2316728 RepID=UPI00148DAAE7|nr:radical SAM protein [Corallococcus carmarthensis]NOK19562.1 radical SAM protein [Corallococcus carmarthensis]
MQQHLEPRPDFRSESHSLSALTMLLTEQCNLRCTYCYIDKNAKRMSRETAERSIDFLFAHAGDEKQLAICFFGGEPLLAPDLLDYVATEAKRRAKEAHKVMVFSITTNATLLTESRVALLQKHRVGVTVSLDGLPEEHDRHRKLVNGEGSFQLIERNLERLVSLSPTIRLTVTPETAPSLQKSVAWLVERGLTKISFSPVFEAAWDEETLSTYYDALGSLYRYQVEGLKRDASYRVGNLFNLEDEMTSVMGRGFGCGAARKMVAIDAQGFMYPCHRFVGYFRNAEAQRIGHVASGFDVDRRGYYIESCHRSTHTGCGSGLFEAKVAPEEKQCTTCSLSPGCGSACMAVNEHMTGDPRKPDPIHRVFSQIHASLHLDHRSDLVPLRLPAPEQHP